MTCVEQGSDLDDGSLRTVRSDLGDIMEYIDRADEALTHAYLMMVDLCEIADTPQNDAATVMLEGMATTVAGMRDQFEIVIEGILGMFKGESA